MKVCLQTKVNFACDATRYLKWFRENAARSEPLICAKYVSNFANFVLSSNVLLLFIIIFCDFSGNFHYFGAKFHSLKKPKLGARHWQQLACYGLKSLDFYSASLESYQSARFKSRKSAVSGVFRKLCAQNALKSLVVMKIGDFVNFDQFSWEKHCFRRNFELRCHFTMRIKGAN